MKEKLTFNLKLSKCLQVIFGLDAILDFTIKLSNTYFLC